MSQYINLQGGSRRSNPNNSNNSNNPNNRRRLNDSEDSNSESNSPLVQNSNPSPQVLNSIPPLVLPPAQV